MMLMMVLLLSMLLLFYDSMHSCSHCSSCWGYYSCCYSKCEARDGVRSQKPETKSQWLSFGSAVQWWMLMGLLMKSNGGCRATQSQTQAGEKGLGPKTQNWAWWLGFGSVVLNSSGGCWWMLVIRSSGGCGATHSQTQAGERGCGLKTWNQPWSFSFRLYYGIKKCRGVQWGERPSYSRNLSGWRLGSEQVWRDVTLLTWLPISPPTSLSVVYSLPTLLAPETHR